MYATSPIVFGRVGLAYLTLFAAVSLPCTVTILSCTLISAFCPRVTFAPEASRRAEMLAPLRPITSPPAVSGMSMRCGRGSGGTEIKIRFLLAVAWLRRSDNRSHTCRTKIGNIFHGTKSAAWEAEGRAFRACTKLMGCC